MTVLCAVVQLTSTSNAAENVSSAERLVRRAASYGAKLVATPENTDFLGPHDQKVARAEAVDGPLVQRFGALAAELGIHLVLGSFAERSDDPKDHTSGSAGGSAGVGRCYNTSVLLGPNGHVISSYRKIHLFDVEVGDDVNFRESATVIPGEVPVVAQTALGAIGMSVCYDLRFPELYRTLVERGASILTVPSAFTLTTGKDHWEVLVRARAIETQCYVLAPGQVGRHDDGGLRQSWGHSMIVDPWGHVIARASDGPGIALAELDLDRVRSVRRGMPVASHRAASLGAASQGKLGSGGRGW